MNSGGMSIVLTSPGGEHRAMRVEESLSIGRGPHNAVCLDSAEVSWSHAELRREAGHLVVEDLGSRNGTLVDGAPIDRPVALSPSATVTIGGYTFSIQAPSELLTPRVRLQLQDQATGLRYTVRGGLFVIGDHDEADLRVPEVDEVRITFESGTVTVDGTTVEPPHDLHIAGRTLRLLRSERPYTPTVGPGYEKQCLLRVALSPPEATMVDTHAGTTTHVTARTRVDFLYVLATAILEDASDEVVTDLAGWRSDEDVSLAIWGREGLRGCDGRLNTLTYRLRKQFQAAGFQRNMLQKRAGWTRLDPSRILIELG